MSMIKMIIVGAIVLTLIRYGVIGTWHILASSDVFTIDAVSTALKIISTIFM